MGTCRHASLAYAHMASAVSKALSNEMIEIMEVASQNPESSPEEIRRLGERFRQVLACAQEVMLGMLDSNAPPYDHSS